MVWSFVTIGYQPARSRLSRGEPVRTPPETLFSLYTLPFRSCAENAAHCSLCFQALPRSFNFHTTFISSLFKCFRTLASNTRGGVASAVLPPSVWLSLELSALSFEPLCRPVSPFPASLTRTPGGRRYPWSNQSHFECSGPAAALRCQSPPHRIGRALPLQLKGETPALSLEGTRRRGRPLQHALRNTGHGLRITVPRLATRHLPLPSVQPMTRANSTRRRMGSIRSARTRTRSPSFQISCVAALWRPERRPRPESPPRTATIAWSRSR